MRNVPAAGAACEGHINFHPPSSGGATTHSTIKGKVGIVNIIKGKKMRKEKRNMDRKLSLRVFGTQVCMSLSVSLSRLPLLFAQIV